MDEEMELSVLASIDDINRCHYVLSDGVAEQEFQRFILYHEQCRVQWMQAVQEAQNLQAEVEKGHKSISILENKLRHARDLLDTEKKLRFQIQKEKESLEKQISIVREIFGDETQNITLNNDTMNKLAFLYNRNKPRPPMHGRLDRITEDEMNYTETLLSGQSLSRSEDDLDVSHGNSYSFRKHKISTVEDPTLSKRRSRRSMDMNRSSAKVVELNPNDRVVATTTLTLPKDGHGPITAKSVIEAVPDENSPEENIKKSPRKKSASPAKAYAPSAPLIENGFKRDISPSTINRNIMRYHNFIPKSTMKSENCIVCNKRIRFGRVIHKCRDCRAVSHTDCRNQVPLPCVPVSSTPTMKGFMGTIADYTPLVAPMVPALVVHCVNEVESRGLNEVGLYRISGSEKDVKALKERFLRGKGAPVLTNVDIHTVCCCLKDFLRSLKEPLIIQSLWPDFAAACKSITKETQEQLIAGVNELPQPNRDTLAYLVMHLQRVAECPEVKMPITNIAMVFAPTIVGYSSLDPSHNFMNETRLIVSIMECLLLIPTEFWAQFICVDLDTCATPNTIQPTPIYTPTTVHRSAISKLFCYTNHWVNIKSQIIY
ncbi:LOW QUALITY PROTEIN: rac GTPase-activating protein 1-like [Ctenocephalides felis]|uniref:LOW QUALITY PROTEIN: rac GTPase-activating protein 1-like n=1 Tax=Ctenocephalides felis TaxID=7515 RepID=UPI000E6E2B4A|nr:LOW QUALITY PROTEIN: rac GTPase-activating protein 1-like [Ctenocephalides felis]